MNKILIIFFLFSYNVFATEYYVSVNGNNSNDGSSETKAWRTITHAALQVKSGDTVWIKAGNYGDEQVVISAKGSPDNPISFIGYKNSKGDIKSLYYSYSKDRPLDENEMPLLDGLDRASGLKGISLNRSKYIILKNIQIQNYRWGIHGGSASNSVLERIIGMSFGNIHSTAESGYGAQYGRGGQNIIRESIFLNATGANLRIEGDFNLIDNVRSYSDDNSTGSISATDYYIHINGGNNNIIKNSYVERVGNLDHTGHGFGLKYNCQNNLIENCESVNVKGALEMRHSGVKNNIARRVLIQGPLGSITIRDGANNNIIEECIVKNSAEGVRFYDQTEDGEGGVIAFDNLIKNSIFTNIGVLIVSTKSSKVSKIGYISANKLINCTIDSSDYLYESQLPMDSTNELINCIFTRVKKYEKKNSKYKPEWVSYNNNYYENGFKVSNGANNISVDPGFEDAAKGNYRLKNNSKLIDAGKAVQNVTKDFDGNNRPNGKSHDMGAFEFQDTSSGLINGGAGPDQTICSGQKVLLSAEAGDSFLWNNGLTSRSIIVYPLETTTYSVIITDGQMTYTDNVTVFVEELMADAGGDVLINNGETVLLTATGGDSYLWNNGETTASISVKPNATTLYTVTIKKASCEAIDEVKVTVQESSQQTNVNADAGDDVSVCSGETVNLVGSGGISYLWSTGETTKSIKVAPTRTTTYELKVDNGVTSNLDYVTVTVENCQNIADDNIEFQNNLRVYPNPSSGVINVNISNIESEVVLDLISMSGSIIYSDTMNTEQSNFSKQLDLSSFERGVYFVRVYNSNQNLVKKIVMI